VTGVEARGLGTGVRYGLGVIIRDSPLGASWGHSGFFPGYLTEMRYYPSGRFAVALQFNTSVGRSIGRNAGVVLQELAAIVAEYVPAR
jgi:D-alanyl-D-alanine carboxypeptidase